MAGEEERRSAGAHRALAVERSGSQRKRLCSLFVSSIKKYIFSPSGVQPLIIKSDIRELSARQQDLFIFFTTFMKVYLQLCKVNAVNTLNIFSGFSFSIAKLVIHVFGFSIYSNPSFIPGDTF